MKLPIGELVEENLPLEKIDLEGLLGALEEKQFTGYIVNTIDGLAGIEEGVLLFKKGELIGSFYEYINFNLLVFGDNAIFRSFNSLLASKGVVDIMALSNQQAELVTAFNDKVKVTIRFKKTELEGLIRRQFVTSYAEQSLANINKKDESRQSVLKRLGLSELG